MKRADVSDPAHLREVFAAYPTGVTAVAAELAGVPVGLAANSFTSVSLNPPLVSVCIARTSATWPRLRGSDWVGVNILASHQAKACRSLAGPDGHRFTDLSWRVTQNGAIVLDEVKAWLECRVVSEIPTGDHDIVVLHVHDLAVDHERAPLVFHASRFRELLP